MRTLGVVSFLVILQLENGFYVPGVAPVEFHKSDPIEVKVREAGPFIKNSATLGE